MDKYLVEVSANGASERVGYMRSLKQVSQTIRETHGAGFQVTVYHAGSVVLQYKTRK